MTSRRPQTSAAVPFETMQRIFTSLQGSCRSLEEVLEELEVEHTTEVCEAIDQELFLCDTCGWWCERGEESGAEPGVCDNCQSD